VFFHSLPSPDYLRQVGIPILEQELLTMAIPDISGDADTPVGHISYDLSSITVTAVNIGASSLEISQAGVNLVISSVSVGLHGNW
jgi:lipopolysaccharide-binding protein